MVMGGNGECCRDGKESGCAVGMGGEEREEL